MTEPSYIDIHAYIEPFEQSAGVNDENQSEIADSRHSSESAFGQQRKGKRENQCYEKYNKITHNMKIIPPYSADCQTPYCNKNLYMI